MRTFRTMPRCLAGRADLTLPARFHRLSVTALCEAGTHVMWRWLIKPSRVDERVMAITLLGFLEPGMLLMWDRGFLGYHRVAAVIARGGSSAGAR